MAQDVETAAPQATGARVVALVRRGHDAGRKVLERAETGADRVVLRLDMLKVRVLPSGALAGRLEPDADDTDDWRFLRRPALLGFVALVSIVVGASLTSSPFKLEMSGTWFFGEPSGSGPTTRYMLFGLVAVYGGLVLLARVWYGMLKALARRPGVPIHYLVWILLLWSIPMLVVAPIFSRDIFSYAAQGEMMSRHINPYNYGPSILGAGPYPNPVDPLWANTPAPYGPLFLMVDGLLATASLHHALWTVVLLRLFALAGVALIAYCIPKLARSFTKDPGPVFVLAVLNPLVLLTLIGAGHNDAVMVGLLLAGITAARSGTRCGGWCCARRRRPSRCPPRWASSTSAGSGWARASTGASASGRWPRPPSWPGRSCWPSPRSAASAWAGSATWPPRGPSGAGWPRPPASAWG